jgi:hypothetical protein
MVKSMLADNIALKGLNFLVSDEERIELFLSSTGLSASDLRQIATNPGFLSAILDFICSDEALAKSFATNENLTPENLHMARFHLSGHGYE